MDRGSSVLVLACAVLGVLAWAVSLWWWDRRHGRLPDLLTLPGALVVAMGVVVGGRPWVLLGGVAWAVVYAVMAVWSRGGIGGGDVKLALSVGTIAAWTGVGTLLAAIVLANALAVGEMLLRRTSRHAHGPAMLLGTALSVGVFWVAEGVAAE